MDQRCPRHQIPLVNTSKGNRVCPKCAMTSPAANGAGGASLQQFHQSAAKFNGKRVRQSYQLARFDAPGFAVYLGIDLGQLEAICEGFTIPLPPLQDAIAFATRMPIGFFYQGDPPEFGPTSMDIHDHLIFCDCGHCLAEKGEPLPLECPQCWEPVDGCPACDGDQTAYDEYQKQTKRHVRIHECKICHAKRIVGSARFS